MKIKRDIMWRVGILYLGVVVLSLWMMAKVVMLQVFEGEKYHAKEKALTDKDIIIEANRGNVLACDGRKLACSVPSYRLYMDLLASGLTDKVFNQHVDSLSICLSKYFKDHSVASYKKSLIKARQKGRRYYQVHPRKLSFTELKEVKTFPLFRMGRNKGGFIPEQYDQRKMPFGMLAGRTIGDMRRNRPKEGRVGIENAFDEELSGINGVSSWKRVSGKWVPEEDIEPKDGKDILSTIDVEIQDVADNALRKQLIKHDADHGVVILMEVQTGAVKAMVNLHRKEKGRYTEFYNNYAISEVAEPGSTFKLASILAALEDGVVGLEDSVDTGNGVYRFYDRKMKDSHHGGYGKITVREAFEKSSNVGISRIIFDNYRDNPRRFVDRLYSMGLHEKVGIDILGEGTPLIKYPGEPSWSGVTLPWMSIGYELQMTPLQVLAFYNAIANNGKMVKPMLVKGVYKHGELERAFSPVVLNPSICSLETIEKAHELLVGVVENGTAQNIKNTQYKIAGKTGTAQIAKGNKGYGNKGGGNVEYQASFAGFFPADRPMYSCIVVVIGPSNNVYYGNVVAGSVFKEISDRVYATSYDMIEYLPKSSIVKGVMPYSKGGKKPELDVVFSELGIQVKDSEGLSDWISTQAREYEVEFRRKPFPEGIVPNVKGLGAKDAVCLLENIGIKVVITGRGRVLEQSITPGVSLAKGMKIYLRLG